MHKPAATPHPPWRPLGELTAGTAAMHRRIDATRIALAGRAGRPAGEIELRVAASVVHLGLVARLIAPPLAAIAVGHRLDMRLEGLWWQDTPGGPVPLSVPEPAGQPGTVIADDDGRLIDEVAVPLTAAVLALVPVSSRVLWGNVTSAVNSAARMIAAQRPDLARQAWASAAGCFSHPRLRQERQGPGPGFRRSSCCLIYRLRPGRAAGICGDCVLT